MREEVRLAESFPQSGLSLGRKKLREVVVACETHGPRQNRLLPVGCVLPSSLIHFKGKNLGGEAEPMLVRQDGNEDSMIKYYQVVFEICSPVAGSMLTRQPLSPSSHLQGFSSSPK